MIKSNNYSVTACLQRILRSMARILHTLQTSSTNVHPDFVYGHATIPGKPDLSYEVLAQGAHDPNFPKSSIIVTSGPCNYGWCGKHFVLKYKYMVRTKLPSIAFKCP